jgi:hypothetical protein
VTRRFVAIVILGSALAIVETSPEGLALHISAGAQGPSVSVPRFRVDAAWPKPLPNHWIVGAVAGVAVDARDHVWITHRPSTLQPNETRSIWRAAPPVLEFDQDGALVSSWGGPGAGYEWPQLEHGIYVDDQDNVWLGGGGDKDAQILKFTRQGTFLMQIGHQGQGRGSNDTANLGAAASMIVDAAANELYVADGYVNHRVIVFDAQTGAYKRHWGAYGKKPDDNYFKDGTFVDEMFIAKNTFGSGSVWDLGFSIDPQQTFVIVIDGTNQQVYVLNRKTLQVVDTFGGAGHWAGQFYGAHNLAVDSKGNLFITETYEGKRVQKFSLTR